MNTDQIFKTKIEKSSDFKFDASVANVFDDMVVRSVPFYIEIQRMMTELIRDFAKPDTFVYDLGCSTGTTFLALDPQLDNSVKFAGVDESADMLEKCRNNFITAGVTRMFTLETANLNNNVKIENASVVILCLTLQFIRPINRLRLLQSVYDQLNKGGCIVLVEKILTENYEFNRSFIKYYYDMKRRNNYDEIEISQKREALENVLIPYKLSENSQLLYDAGFSSVETFFKWYNFSGIIAVK
jgi:tRNA (cmo5U34)-methyltransferase